MVVMGMEVLEMKFDVIVNNLVNVSMIGFKKDWVNFEDLLYWIEVFFGLE